MGSTNRDGLRSKTDTKYVKAQRHPAAAEPRSNWECSYVFVPSLDTMYNRMYTGHASLLEIMTSCCGGENRLAFLLGTVRKHLRASAEVTELETLLLPIANSGSPIRCPLKRKMACVDSHKACRFRSSISKYRVASWSNHPVRGKEIGAIRQAAVSQGSWAYKAAIWAEDTNRRVHSDAGGGFSRTGNVGKGFILGREKWRNKRLTPNTAALVQLTLRADQGDT